MKSILRRTMEEHQSMKHLMLGVAAFVVMVLVFPQSAFAQLRTCSSPTALKAQALRSLAARYIMHSGHAKFRQDYGIVAGDTSSLSVITADSVCEAVTASVDALDAATHSSTALVVVRLQNFFMACDPSGTSVLPVYLLDDSYVVQAVMDIGR